MTGSGTIGDPYIIGDATDLQNIENDLEAYYELGNNINAWVTSTWNGGAGFLPIGISGTQFTGHFDGKFYTVTGLHINRPNTDYCGLFGQGGMYGQTAVVKQVGLISPYVRGRQFVGAMFGQTAIECEYCYIQGGYVYGEGFVGGFGGNISNVIKCWANLNSVNGSGGETGLIVGGFCGSAMGSGTDCYSWSDVVGATGYTASGFVSSCTATGGVTRCYSIGRITGTATENGFGAERAGSIGGCYWDRDYSSVPTSEDGTGLTTTEAKTQGSYEGWDFATIWIIDPDINGGYPYLRTPAIPVPGLAVTTDAATSVATDSATLNGTLVEDVGEACECGFDWGLTTGYGSSGIAEASLLEGNSFDLDISSLLPGTIYHFRAYATNSSGTAFGIDRTLTTIGTSPAVYPTDSRARVTGLVHRFSPGNYGLEVYFGDVVTEWDIADYLGPSAPSIPPWVVEGPKYPTGPGYPQQDPGYVPPEEAVTPPVTAPIPVITPILTPTLEASKVAARITFVPGAAPLFVETVTGAIAEHYKGTALGKIAGVISTMFRAMNPFRWFGR